MQENNTWFEANGDAILNSQAMLNYVPAFPFPGVIAEAGIFYESHRNENWDRLDNLVTVISDPSQLDGVCGREVLLKVGHVERTLAAGFQRLREYFDSLRA